MLQMRMLAPTGLRNAHGSQTGTVGREQVMGEEQDDKERGFKVQDRRRFTADGEMREDADNEASAMRPATAPPEESREAVAGRSDAAEVAADEGPEDLSFSSFVIGLASQAFVFLGAVADPQTGVVRKDLVQAKAMIDILSMLSEKTAGNLDEHEGHMMEEMLYELRIQYVKELRSGMPEGGRR
jgi:Domain of unknown function (DUF1844)